MHLRPRIALTALLSVVVLLAAACGNVEPATAPDADGPLVIDAIDADVDNDADLTFLQGMIPHHEEAVDMARLVPDRTDRPELNQLAENVISSQQAEIDQMEQMLTEAGAERDDAGNGGHGDMPGMMGAEELERLASLDGIDFDLAFIDMMIAHHEGAITSAEQVIDGGANPQARQLAEGVVAEQEAEIAQMTAWREQWTAAGS